MKEKLHNSIRPVPKRGFISSYNMKKYSTKEASELTGLTDVRLSQMRTGRTSTRKGKAEWSEPPLLDSSDYEQVIENGRAKIYYFDSAIEKIRAKRENKETTEIA